MKHMIDDKTSGGSSSKGRNDNDCLCLRCCAWNRFCDEIKRIAFPPGRFRAIVVEVDGKVVVVDSKLPIGRDCDDDAERIKDVDDDGAN